MSLLNVRNLINSLRATDQKASEIFSEIVDEIDNINNIVKNTSTIANPKYDVWVNVPLNSLTFSTSNVGATWVVQAGDFATFKYLIESKSKIMTVIITLNATTITGVGAIADLIVTIPDGFKAIGSTDTTFNWYEAGAFGSGAMRVVGNGIHFFKNLAAVSWVANVDQTYISGEVTFQVDIN